MQKFQSWREFLSTVINDRDEKFRLAQELNVTPLTLTRWVQGASTPQTQQLQSLLHALPRYQKTLHPLIAKEFEQMDLAVPELTNQVIDIPSVFYAHVLSGSTALSHPIRFWSLANMVIQQALGQLDPLRLGLVIKVVCCMPPSGGGKILSLRESLGLGTSIWGGNLEHTSLLLGAGSLASYAVTSHQSVVIDRLADYDLFPAQERAPDEMSAAAHPIERGMRVAGCLFMASTQEGYFTPTRLSLLHRYADLLALVFASEDFYDIQAFELRPMPRAQEQLRYLSSFRPRMAEVMVEAAKTSPIDTLRAEQQVWQQFEALFLDLLS